MTTALRKIPLGGSLARLVASRKHYEAHCGKIQLSRIHTGVSQLHCSRPLFGTFGFDFYSSNPPRTSHHCYFASSTKHDVEDISETTNTNTAIDGLSEEDAKMFQLLMKYKEEHGDCHVPVGNNKIYRDIRKQLGIPNELVLWILKQRKEYKSRGKRKTSHDALIRIGLLESIGFIWSNRDSHWQRWFNIYDRTYRSRKGTDKFDSINRGDAALENDYSDPSNGLDVWVDEQRKSYKAGRLSPGRELLLKEVEFVFEVRHKAWMKNYSKLCQYKEQHGNAFVPVKYEKDPNFGYWVARQRALYNKGRLSDDKVKLLDDIGLPVDHHKEKWNSFFASLEEFHAKHGHCRVPRSETRLSTWVDRTRRHFRKRLLQLRNLKSETNASRLVSDLDRIGFEWEVGEGGKCQARLRGLTIEVDVYKNRWQMHFKELYNYRYVYQTIPT